MTLALLVALLSGQVIYEWVDAKGQSHFTDDRSTIPTGVKARETRGEEVSVVPSSAPSAASPPAERGAPAPVAPPARDTCAVAREDVARAEEKVEAAKAAAARQEDDESMRCQQVLLTHGQGNFAQCMAGRAEAVARDDSSQKQLEVARETLRVAQAQGCR